jgi:acetylornithine deacetylase
MDRDGGFAEAYGERARSTVERLVGFESTQGAERPAQEWLREELAALGFDVYEWTADADRLAGHPSFPDDPATIDVADRPSVAGVLELGDPDAGPTVVLNGHVDVVPATESAWSSDPFEATWDGDHLTARGAADMKSGLAASVYAARYVADGAVGAGLDGRLVVESVVGEEAGGIGAAAAALDSPYPFERDAALVAEPTELRPVTAVEGTVMAELTVRGRSAHAATRWRGESVLPHFERIRTAFLELERERSERVTHPLYDDYPIPWPVECGVVRAGNWASSTPDELTAQWRLGVAPGESVADVEAAFRNRLDEVVAESDWLSAHQPAFERFSVQFEPAEVDADEPIVRAVRTALSDRDLVDDPTGATYGADSRHYVASGIPTVVFGPGSIDQAHFPDETVDWTEVETAGDVIADAARRLLS